MSQPSILSALFEKTRPMLDAALATDVSVPVRFLDDLYQTRDTEDMLHVYSRWCRQLAKSDRCAVALDDGGGYVVKHALSGDFAYGKGIRHEVNDTATGEVFLGRKALFIPDVSAIGYADIQQVAVLGYRAAILAPIATDTRCFGIVASSYREVPDPPGALLVMMQAIARCLATQLLVIKQMENLNDMARTDALTGAKNRHFLMEQLGPLWEEWRAGSTPFCYISIDVDHFKKVNDTYGHDVGDDVLREMVRRLQAVSRQSDSVVRTGGEEFAIILRDNTLAQALTVSKRLKDAVTSEKFISGDLALGITVSIGLTTVLDADGGVNDALRRSDAALYHAKNAGRDQIVVAQDNQLLAQ